MKIVPSGSGHSTTYKFHSYVSRVEYRIFCHTSYSLHFLYQNTKGNLRFTSRFQPCRDQWKICLFRLTISVKLRFVKFTFTAPLHPNLRQLNLCFFLPSSFSKPMITQYQMLTWYCWRYKNRKFSRSEYKSLTYKREVSSNI
jgi:hypothetical protein